MRLVGALLAMALGLCVPGSADALDPPDETLLPSVVRVQYLIGTPSGRLSSEPGVAAAVLGSAPLAVPGLNLPLWRARGRFGQDIYGLSGQSGEAAWGVGGAPVLAGMHLSGYTVGFRWVRRRWELRGDMISDVNYLGRSEHSSVLSASLRMDDDLLFRLQFGSRSLSRGHDSGDESYIGGGFEFGL